MKGSGDRTIGAMRVAIVALAIAMLFIVLNVPLPTWLPHSRLLGALQKTSHGLLFAGVACIALWLLGSTSWRRFLVAWLITAGLAVATELSQFLSTRNPMLTDVRMDLLGATAASALWALFSRTLTPMSAPRRAALAGVACVATVLILMPLVGPVSSLLERSHRFPILFSAEFTAALGMTESMTEDEDVAIAVRDGALDVELLAGPLPGVVITDFSPDWRGYHALVIDIENRGTLPLAIEVHMRDFGSSTADTDRFNAGSTLSPGQRTSLRFALSAVAAAPRGRTMRIDDMSIIAVYRTKPGSDRLLLHSIRLE